MFASDPSDMVSLEPDDVSSHGSRLGLNAAPDIAVAVWTIVGLVVTEGLVIGLPRLFPGGETIPLWVHGVTAGLVAVVFLATVLLVVEGPLRRSLEHLDAFGRSLIESFPDATMLVDRLGVIRHGNPLVKPVFGFEPEELIGRSFLSLIAPSDREAHRRMFEETLDDVIELVGETKDRRSVSLSARRRRLLLGGRTWYLVTVVDLPPRDRAVREGEPAIKTPTESANRAENALLAHISHDIRVPLTGILGYAELLLQSGDQLTTDERSEYLRAIQDSGQNLLHLMDDILDFSRMEAGELDLNPTRCSPTRILAGLVAATKSRAEEHGLSLGYRWVGKAPRSIHVDPARFRQVLTRLLENALRFTHKGEIHVDAELIDDPKHPELVIDVLDTGIGISEERLGAIFHPSEPGDETSIRPHGGVDFGLGISRRITQAMGGQLTGRSEIGQGSVFTLRLPTGDLRDIERVDVESAGRIEPTTKTRDSKSGELPPCRILVVEDGETNRKLIRLFLQRAGANVVCAEDGQEGYDMAVNEPFDLIVMDMQMPVLDGYTATTRLREHGLGLPIIALTAHALRGDDQKCLDAGCSAYLSKPVGSEKLIQKVGAELAHAGMASP